jgi:hypothetical protein
MVASQTIDDFVQGVLERKGALVRAVVDGRAMAPDLGGDVLDELQRRDSISRRGFADVH